ncbi:uroporphyrinogen decarboxylase family protein [Thermofilum sp.]|uniref:uroporphyrinogen decarboxylase family protein n=1 Tax=Thermofilum sp. TaxID=1961369 RepID=UPI003161F631
MQLVDPRFMRDNYLRAIEFRSPTYIPCFVSIPLPTWRRHGEKLIRIVKKHRLLFPWFDENQLRSQKPAGKPPVFRDEWGCVWKFTVDGLQGIVVKHPLSDWSRMKDFKPPDPEAGLPREGEPPIPWSEVEAFVEGFRGMGGLVVGFMPHGFFFLRLTYLRGYLNFLKDLVLEPPELEKLVELVVEYNVEVVKRLVRLGVDIVSFGDDLGTQRGLPFSPASFRKHLLPGYKKIFSTVRKGGAKVRLHSDGYVMDIADDLVSAGVHVLNVQDLVNGLNRLAKLKGKVAIEVDIDRQYLLPFGSPDDIRSHIRKVVDVLGSKRGGLLITAEVLHDVPLNNIEALLEALEKLMMAHHELQ